MEYYYVPKISEPIEIFKEPELSEWTCHLFGAENYNGLTWRPFKGKEPNAFWRLMQFLVFGNRWVKS